jgi:hypothetical protein
MVLSMFPVDAGMPAGSHWALYGGDNDPTLGMRNWLAYDAARAVGSWAPRAQPTEVFLVQVESVLLSMSHKP